MREPESSESENLWADWPPEGSRHSVQQESSNDFRADVKSGLFYGQPCGCFFVANGFVSGDDGASERTLCDVKVTLVNGDQKPEESTNLHAIVNDFPLEFLAILGGKIPRTIGKHKGRGGARHQTERSNPR